MSKTHNGEADATTPALSVTPAPNSITLETPLKRGDQTITAVNLRKPAAGELRGVALADLMRLDVAALIMVLPRITSPTLTPQDVSGLDLVDLTALGGELLDELGVAGQGGLGLVIGRCRRWRGAG